MSLPEALANVRRRPGMYLPASVYDAAASFLQGYDAALSGGLLFAFREWLIVKLDDGNNLSWPALVLKLKSKSVSCNEQTTPEEHKLAIEFLFALLEEFLTERDTPGGPRRIYAAYDRWIKRQDWYGPTSPAWISENGK